MARKIELPALSSIYRRAAVDAVTSRLSSTGSLRTLEVEPVLAQHPGITEAQAEKYRRLFNGEPFDGVHRTSLPSVLVHIAGFPVQMALMSAEEFPLPLLGMVHLSNTVEHRRPITAGQPLQILVGAENFRPHRRGTQVDITVEVYAADEDPQSPDAAPLWRGVSTYLGRGSYIAGSPKEAGSRTGRGEFTPPRPTGRWTLGADAGREYAAVSGDFNPIHLSSLTAKALGQRTTIVHGMYSAARMLEGREPEQAGHRWSIEFEAPITLPASVAFAAERQDDSAWRFTGWNPRKNRRHFTGTLTLP
ncbi:MaoC/PaaZ C-terminal domain-containing protein [Nesterenkonia sp.]|uniref:MaoC/PaaZ C-terminal domain-containing protein n=1 Tax=Nesterenkonia sp. TaxID=704201 RepID=UPI002607D4E1|nr:MaoC/PaaZ C-terminal domain-containing protein [Nesterenkonia sp.]